MLASKVGKAAVLAPVLGCLLGLWRAVTRDEQEQEQRDMHLMWDTDSDLSPPPSSGPASPLTPLRPSHNDTAPTSRATPMGQAAEAAPSSSLTGTVLTPLVSSGVSSFASLEDPSAGEDVKAQARAPRTQEWLIANVGRHYDARFRRHVAHLAGLDWLALMPVAGVGRDLGDFLMLVAALERNAPVSGELVRFKVGTLDCSGHPASSEHGQNYAMNT